MAIDLKSKFEQQQAKIGIIGLGYVGLPLSVEFAKKGFAVTGIDIDKQRVNQLNQGYNYIPDVDAEEFAELVKSKRIKATTDFSKLKQLDAVSICVPTPLNKLKDPDVSHIMDVLKEIRKYLHKKILIILESTTYPGTTRELILPQLESAGYKVGQDFFLCFSPERIDPGNRTYHVRNTPKVVGGVTQSCTEVGTAMYEQIIDSVVPVTSPETAEMVKLLENTFRSINIGLVNEMAIMCEKLGVDVWEVTEAAETKPFGYMKFTPGPGLGGHCIPIDPHYLAWKMKTLDYRARFIELAGEINTDMPNHVVRMVSRGLNQQKKSLNGSHVLVLGVAYKKDIDDVRESPALDIIQLLEDSGASVEYFDPHVPRIRWNGEFKHSLADITEKGLKSQDAVVIVTDHSDVNYELVRAHAHLIIDTRNIYPLVNEKHILRLGVGHPTPPHTEQ